MTFLDRDAAAGLQVYLTHQAFREFRVALAHFWENFEARQQRGA
jgi:hypothetical protein